MKEGIYKMINGAVEKVDPRLFIIVESWRKTKARLQEQYPTAKIKYSYKTKQFTISYDQPQDLTRIESITITTPTTNE